MLKIIRAGIYTTIQDEGRPGFRRLGISQGGALDLPALKMANMLVGNAPAAAGLEITLGQFCAELTQAGWIALTGAGCDARLDGQLLWTGWRYPVKAGQRIQLNVPLRGMRSYLAISGGINVPEMLGSCSTDLKAGFGGHQGRLIKEGDELPLGKASRLPKESVGIKQLLFGNRVRAVPGPEYHEFSSSAQESFWRSAWQLSPQSNRMGYRLTGGELSRNTTREMLSHGLLPGVVQVPHNGQPIVLMADAQTTGGYPRIACVIEADLFHLAQIRLGEPVHFIKCTLEDALKAKAEQQLYLQQIERGLATGFHPVEAK
ncbi:biotin-dependent carboxyltransferase family protein [Yersinia nurmii]|uniref:Biotin-dependent carboxylase domain-containing protein n=1 Tax=Yersinia nurmii TaxID=685706 RepID=A0AAW7K5K0_9GAMM|nr:5-oxoprolinase subunit PxpC [Yersinia nurmii]MDN0087867.1 biotin-dependent carboxyltransferase family protein [Yersinia nurmii]CND99626.1 biotin-dependent carboxylase domain-containing protein [Yersinia nurmii]